MLIPSLQIQVPVFLSFFNMQYIIHCRLFQRLMDLTRPPSFVPLVTGNATNVPVTLGLTGDDLVKFTEAKEWQQNPA